MDIWFTNPKVTALLDDLHSLDINMLETENTAAPLSDTTWVITGTFSLPRDEAATLITRAGAKVTSSVSKKTTHLLAGFDA